MKRDALKLENTTRELNNFLDSSIVISEKLKEHIRQSFYTTSRRYDSAKDLQNYELFIEYHVLEKELKHLSIFSDTFFSKIFTIWHNLSYTVILKN